MHSRRVSPTKHSSKIQWTTHRLTSEVTARTLLSLPAWIRRACAQTVLACSACSALVHLVSACSYVAASACTSPAGNSTGRLAQCDSLPLPDSFKQYLNTSFLGPRRFVEAGPVNYTYFQFGPLNPAATGLPPPGSLCCHKTSFNV